MNYEKIYKQIIEKRKLNPLHKDEYGENHHIIPRCLGGSDEINNLIRLTAREHFICHMLLAEMYPKHSNEWYKMNHAFIIMKANSSNQFRYINNRYYELKKKDFAITQRRNQSGNKNSSFDTVWINSLKERKSIKVHKSLLSDYLENGYELGRVCNWDKKLNPDKYKIKKARVKRKYTRPKIDTNLYYKNLVINIFRKHSILKIFKIDLDITGVEYLENMLTELYIDKQLSTNNIADLIKTSNETIRNYLKFFNIKRRSFQEGIRLSVNRSNADVV